MSEFQNYLDGTLMNIQMPQVDDEPVYEDYDVYPEIVEQLKHIRSEQKLTQKDLAGRCGLTQANISNIEKGLARPTIDSLKKIADALGKKTENRV